jgi:amino acid transporter
MDNYKKNSLTLKGAVALGTGVMIGAGIFALLGIVSNYPEHGSHIFLLLEPLFLVSALTPISKFLMHTHLQEV